jgi:hypothetical protein
VHVTPQTELSARQVSGMMRRSIFCFCPPGDMEYTTRFFEAVLNGCIPVVVAYNASSSSTSSSRTWHIPGSAPFYNSLPFAIPPAAAKSAVVGGGEQATGINFVKSTLKIDYESIAIVLTEEEARSPLATRQVLTHHLSSSSVAEKRQNLLEIRSLLVYDFLGEEEDAFSALLQQLVTMVSGIKR